MKLQDDDVASRLLSDVLYKYSNFLAFGEMMEDKYGEFYENKKFETEKASMNLELIPSNTAIKTIESENKIVLNVSQPEVEANLHIVNNGVDSKRFVRVLWDIENVQVPKKHKVLALIANLQKFLADQSPSLFGPGIDLRITAFFNPSSSRVPSHVVDELDRAAVELVWVSTKREDADRKIGGGVICTMYLDVLYTTNGFLLLLNPGVRIQQEMQVLKPEKASFMLISSDNDFRHHIQLLRNTGYEAIVVHNVQDSPKGAVDGSSSWQQALELHATKAFRWRDIVNYKGPETPPLPLLTDGNAAAAAPVPLPALPAALDMNPFNDKRDEDNSDSEDKVVYSGRNGQKRNRRKRFVEQVRSLHNNISNSIDDGEVNDDQLVSKASKEGGLGWRVCICSRWVGPYGVVLFNESSEAVPEDYSCSQKDVEDVGRLLAGRLKGEAGNGSNSVRVYVHYKSLVTLDRCFLTRGDVVLCKVESSER